MNTNLPKDSRPDLNYRKLKIGLDLPGSFVDSMKSLDPDFHFVFHPFRVSWPEPIINQYSGEEEDYRPPISEFAGTMAWGWVLRDGKNNPILDESWHVWRLKRDCGWAHICDIKAKDFNYLTTLTERLWLQSLSLEKGKKEYSRRLREEQANNQEKKSKDVEQLFTDTVKENKKIFKRAVENAQRGHLAPTNPVKETIVSYAGQVNRSRIVRPAEEHEGGLVIPEQFKR